MSALLETNRLMAFYGDFQALFGVDLCLDRGETIAIIGANGAGKTTALRSIAGLVPCAPDAVLLDGRAIGGLPAHRIAGQGVALVPEGRKLFPSLSVEENLRIGGDGFASKGPWTLDAVYQLFPLLRERRKMPATALSGGQQQMVAIGRALLSNPSVLLCDELSLGLAPIVVREIYQAFPVIREKGASIIIVEQDIVQALKVADRVYCMMEGRITLQGIPQDLSREDIHAAYFGALH